MASYACRDEICGLRPGPIATWCQACSHRLKGPGCLFTPTIGDTPCVDDDGGTWYCTVCGRRKRTKGGTVCVPCIRKAQYKPTHRTAGTAQTKSGRPGGASGEANARCKLTAQRVVEIRQRHAAGVSQYRLAKDYGVSHTCISKIVLRQTWREI